MQLHSYESLAGGDVYRIKFKINNFVPLSPSSICLAKKITLLAKSQF